MGGRVGLRCLGERLRLIIIDLYHLDGRVGYIKVRAVQGAYGAISVTGLLLLLAGYTSIIKV